MKRMILNDEKSTNQYIQHQGTTPHMDQEGIHEHKQKISCKYASCPISKIMNKSNMTIYFIHPNRLKLQKIKLDIYMNICI